MNVYVEQSIVICLYYYGLRRETKSEDAVPMYAPNGHLLIKMTT
jgi:hypothetical protein